MCLNYILKFRNNSHLLKVYLGPRVSSKIMSVELLVIVIKISSAILVHIVSSKAVVFICSNLKIENFTSKLESHF